MKLALAEQMRMQDARAIQTWRIPEEILMEQAASAALRLLKKKQLVKGKRVCLFCGPGNNGGDALALGRLLYSEGAVAIDFVFARHVPGYRGAALGNLEAAEALGFPFHEITEKESLEVLLEKVDVVVDALFGTGLSRLVEGMFRLCIAAINQFNGPVLSLDIPSGIHGNTGQVMGIAVKATFTVSFGLFKPGNLLYPGFDYGGTLYGSRIGFPPELLEDPQLFLHLNTFCQPVKRDNDGYKGSFGRVLVIAGSRAYRGAPRLAASAALKSGAGYVTLAIPESLIPEISAQSPELVFSAMAETPEGGMASSNLEKLQKQAERADIIIMGPGMGQKEETRDLIQELVNTCETPLILDGDGLTAFSELLDAPEKSFPPLMLTPHWGEMETLTGLSIQEMKERKIEVLRETCRQLEASIVLKGAHSLVGHPDGRIALNLSGNNGMGTAGSGDVLAGIIAGAWCACRDCDAALDLGVFIHGLAGDKGAALLGKTGLCSSDLLESLPAAWKDYCEKQERVYSSYLPQEL